MPNALPEQTVVPVDHVPVSCVDIDHRRAPLLEVLWRERKRGTVPFTTPGHKLGAAADPALRALLGDAVFTADLWLGAGATDTAREAAEALGAAAWDADRAFYLGNGSSSGNHALMLAVLRPGDQVVVGRDAHVSVLNALILSGASPIWVSPKLHPALGLSLGVDPSDVAATLDAHPNARLLVITSPSYWGVATDVVGIVETAHAYGVPIHVDQAWGAHLAFHPALPPAAMACGADATVVSAHKVLSALSPGAVLTITRSRLNADRLADAVRMTQTTSPLLPVLASIDACRRQMALQGEALLDRVMALAATARGRLAAIPGLQVIDAAALGLPVRRYDPTRLVVDVRGLGVTGLEVERVLRDRHGVAPEMSDLTGIVCLVTVGDTEQSINRLVAALEAVAQEGIRVRWPRHVLPGSAEVTATPGPQALLPREAFFAPARAVPLKQAVGKVAAELVVPYPPGIPALVPGEVITANKVDRLRLATAAGVHMRGAANPALSTIRVVG